MIDFDRASLAIVYSHLAGVVAWWFASYLDRMPAKDAVWEFLGGTVILLGLLTFVLCPLLAVWLSATRLNGRRAVVLLCLTMLIEVLQLFAMLPLVQ